MAKEIKTNRRKGKGRITNKEVVGNTGDVRNTEIKSSEARNQIKAADDRNTRNEIDVDTVKGNLSKNLSKNLSVEKSIEHPLPPLPLLPPVTSTERKSNKSKRAKLGKKGAFQNSSFTSEAESPGVSAKSPLTAFPNHLESSAPPAKRKAGRPKGSRQLSSDGLTKPSQHFSGNLSSFDQKFRIFCKKKADFKVISYGETRKLVSNRFSFNYFGVNGSKKLVGGFLANMVIRDINAYIELGVNLPQKENIRKPYLVVTNSNHIRWHGMHKQVRALDLNHCFWRTIFQLGYITERTYKRGLEKDGYKDARLVSVGILNKLSTISFYKDGVKTHEEQSLEYYNKYSPFYWAVINRVYELLFSMHKLLEGDMFMFLTDCVYYHPDRRAEVIEVVKSFGYGYKEFRCVFEDVSENRIKWWNEDGKLKSLSYGRGDGAIKPEKAKRS